MSLKLPYNHDAELGVIGCCLLGGLDTAVEAVEAIPASAFSREDCQEAWAVIESLSTQGKTIDLVTVLGEWPRLHRHDMPPQLMTVTEQVPSAANLPYYTEQLLDVARRRKMMFAAHDLLNRAADPSTPLESLLAELEANLSDEEMRGTTVLNATDCCRKLIDHLQARLDLQGQLSGLVTGFDRLDRLTDGLQAGEQTIIASRPSMGKTALGLNILHRVCMIDKNPTLFVTLEMSTQALMRRLLSGCMEIPMSALRSGAFTKGDYDKFAHFQARAKEAPLFIEEAVGGLDTNRLAAVVRRHVRKHGIKLVVIDYLQKISPTKKHEKRTYEVGEVSTTLKALAVQTGAAFLTLAQLNRESEKDKNRVPRLSDLADSGQIERDADTVALIHRKRDDPTGDAVLLVAKQRDGELGQVNLTFNGRYCRFENPRREAPSEADGS